MKKLLPLAVVAIICIVLVLRYSGDDALLPEVREWASNPPEDLLTAANGYVFFVGILANETTEPFIAGLEIIKSQSHPGIDTPFSGPEPLSAESQSELVLPAHPLLCSKGEIDCINRVVTSRPLISEMLKTHELLINRYQRFIRHAQYKTSTMPISPEIQLPYRAVTIMNRLNHLVAIEHLLSGRGSEFSNQLLEDIKRLRSLASVSDDFRLKQMLLLALTEDLRLLLGLYVAGYNIGEQFDYADSAFDPLSVAERTLEYDMRRKFYLHVQKVTNFNRGAGSTRYPQASEAALDWPTGMLLKPNRTLNRVFPRFYRNYVLSVLSPRDYLEYLKQPFPLTNVIRRDNLVGSILNRRAVTNYQGYIGLFNDLDCFIKLARIRLALPANLHVELVTPGDMPVDTSNPYTGLPVVLDQDSEQMCFDTRGTDRICVAINTTEIKLVGFSDY